MKKKQSENKARLWEIRKIMEIKYSIGNIQKVLGGSGVSRTRQRE